jgi:hypothetical protein
VPALDGKRKRRTRDRLTYDQPGKPSPTKWCGTLISTTFTAMKQYNIATLQSSVHQTNGSQIPRHRLTPTPINLPPSLISNQRISNPETPASSLPPFIYPHPYYRYPWVTLDSLNITNKSHVFLVREHWETQYYLFDTSR